jgi:branched-chain amino acid transport system permease protein
MIGKRTLLETVPLIGLGLAILALILLPPILPAIFVVVLTQALIFGIVAMSLDVLIGYTNLGSLGHGTFFAIGAYTAGILVTRYQAGFELSLVSGVLMAAVASAIFAPLFLRTSGIYFLLITLAVAMSVWGLALRWVSLTGGENGISRILRPSFGWFLDLRNELHFYYLILVFSILGFILLFLIVQSPFGKTLVGIRDSEERMKVLGYNVWLHKYIALIISGAFAGLGGCLFAYFNKFVGPDEASLSQVMEFVLMVCIGGPGTLFGASIGAFIIVFSKFWVSIYTKRWLLIVGIIYIVSAKYAPEGIMGLLAGVVKRDKGYAKRGS